MSDVIAVEFPCEVVAALCCTATEVVAVPQGIAVGDVLAITSVGEVPPDATKYGRWVVSNIEGHEPRLFEVGPHPHHLGVGAVVRPGSRWTAPVFEVLGVYASPADVPDGVDLAVLLPPSDDTGISSWRRAFRGQETWLFVEWLAGAAAWQPGLWVPGAQVARLGWPEEAE